MDISPLQHHDGVNAASALENLAHRLVAVHHRKTPETASGRRVEDVIDIPIFSQEEFGLDDPMPAQAISFLDRIKRFFNG
ncbi:MAG: hypothetical protein ACM3Q1_02495 [Bacteroidales bacterium]